MIITCILKTLRTFKINNYGNMYYLCHYVISPFLDHSSWQYYSTILVTVSIINQTEAGNCSCTWSWLTESGWELIYGELWHWGGVSQSARDPSVDKSWEQHLWAHAKALTQTQRERFHCHSIWCTRPSVHYMAKTVNNAQGVCILKERHSYRSYISNLKHKVSH